MLGRLPRRGAHLCNKCPVLFGVSLHSLFSMPSGVNDVRPCRMRMMRRLLVVTCLVMLGSFLMVAGGMRKML